MDIRALHDRSIIASACSVTCVIHMLHALASYLLYVTCNTHATCNTHVTRTALRHTHQTQMTKHNDTQMTQTHNETQMTQTHSNCYRQMTQTQIFDICPKQ